MGEEKDRKEAYRVWLLACVGGSKVAEEWLSAIGINVDNHRDEAPEDIVARVVSSAGLVMTDEPTRPDGDNRC